MAAIELDMDGSPWRTGVVSLNLSTEPGDSFIWPGTIDGEIYQAVFVRGAERFSFSHLKRFNDATSRWGPVTDGP